MRKPQRPDAETASSQQNVANAAHPIPVLEGRPDPIADALKRMHDSIVNEPLPDDFLALLDDIDAKLAQRTAEQ